jgi:hypothetical protein
MLLLFLLIMGWRDDQRYQTSLVRTANYRDICSGALCRSNVQVDEMVVGTLHTLTDRRTDATVGRPLLLPLPLV